MKARMLTDLFVRNAKTPGEVSDLGQRGLRLAVHETGRKSWVVRYRHPVSGISRKLTLTPGLSLAAARKVAADAMFSVSQKIDPIDAKKAKAEATVLADENTVMAICTKYMDLQGGKLRSQRARASVLKRHIYPRLGSRPVTDLKRAEIVAALDHVERTAGVRAADMALAVLRAILHWHERRSDGFRSPIIAGMARVKPSERVRDRSLSDAEIKAVWEACGNERMGVFGQAMRFLILSGARRSEVADMRRSELEVLRDNGDEFRVWRLPARRSKSKTEIVRPLSRAALAIIDNQPIIGDGDAATAFVFSMTGLGAISLNHMRKKHLLDELSGVTDWRVHDLRRTFRSMLSRLRVPFETSERLLGHSQPTLVRTYDQHSHLAAMQEAVDRLAAEIERIIIEHKTGKVINFPR